MAVSGVSIFRIGCGTQFGSVSVLGGLPGSANWQALRNQVGERLIQVQSPLASCMTAGGGATCSAALQNLKNPFFNEDDPGATQTTGWLDAWTPAVSPYAVAAESAQDIVAAVNFACENKTKLVVKGTGHDYLMCDPVMTDLAADVVGPDVKFHHAKLNVKSERGTRGFKWHQDIPAWPHTDYSPVSIGVYIEGCTPEQGPVRWPSRPAPTSGQFTACTTAPAISHITSKFRLPRAALTAA